MLLVYIINYEIFILQYYKLDSDYYKIIKNKVYNFINNFVFFQNNLQLTKNQNENDYGNQVLRESLCCSF